MRACGSICLRAAGVSSPSRLACVDCAFAGDPDYADGDSQQWARSRWNQL